MDLSPLRHRWFALFTGAIGLGSVADEVARLALPLLVLDLTHDIGAAALLRVVQTVPYIFFGAIAGALIDRLEKRRLLIGCDIAGILVTAAIPISFSLGVFSLGLLYAIGFLLGMIEVVYGVTTDFSVVPALVDDNELTAANAVYLAADRSARIIGPTLGGLAIAAFSTPGAMWIAALAFVPTIFVYLRMPPLDEPGSRVTTPLTPRNIGREIGEGFSTVWSNRILKALLVLMFVANLGGQGMQTLLLYVLREEHGLSEVTIGLALSAGGAFALFGSLFAPRIAKGRPLGHTMIGVVLVAGVGATISALTRAWPVVVAGFTVRQMAWQNFIVYGFVPRQREVPANIRGRVNGAFRTIVLVSNSSSAPLLSLIATAVSTSAAFGAAAGLAALAAVIAVVSPLREYSLRDEPEAASTARDESFT